MSYPQNIDYAVTFNQGGHAEIDIPNIPVEGTITVSWNGTPVYGPTTTNEPSQHSIPANYQASGTNNLRVVLAPGADETYARGGISPTQHQRGELPRA